MSGLGDRHSGSLGGRLQAASPISAGVVVAAGDDEELSTQLTATMLVNLLARLDGIVEQIVIEAPAVPLRPRVTPLAPAGVPLGEALAAIAEEIGGVGAAAGDSLECDVVLSVGPGPAPRSGWRVHGRGFAALITRDEVAADAERGIPFGPFGAACIAAGEVFRLAKLLEAAYVPIETLSYSFWDNSSSSEGMSNPGPALPRIELDLGLAGAGAVGTAFLQTMWSTLELAGRVVAADSDPEGVDETNLNRCVTFGRRHLGEPKASTVATVLAASDFELIPVDGPYERRSVADPPPPMLVSAVDTNRSRISLQAGFWPARLFGASTRDLRAEITRFGPPGAGPCLGCFNPPEVDVPDDIRREELRAMSEAQLNDLSVKLGVEVAAIRTWAQTGECGQLGDAVLSELRSQDGAVPQFSVGFVSVFAGIGLAAEVVKEHLAAEVPGAALTAGVQIRFQFMNPAVAGNGAARPVQRDAKCPFCRPDTPAAGVWAQRYSSWRPAGDDEAAA